MSRRPAIRVAAKTTAASLECLLAAYHDADTARKNLLEVLHTATAVEGLILLPLIARAADLARDIDLLLSAKSGEGR